MSFSFSIQRDWRNTFKFPLTLLLFLLLIMKAFFSWKQLLDLLIQINCSWGRVEVEAWCMDLYTLFVLFHLAAPKAFGSQVYFLSFPLAHVSAWPQFDTGSAAFKAGTAAWRELETVSLIKLLISLSAKAKVLRHLELSYWTCLTTRWKAWPKPWEDTEMLR